MFNKHPDGNDIIGLSLQYHTKQYNTAIPTIQMCDCFL